jgi:ornithine carbamoyltransferase
MERQYRSLITTEDLSDVDLRDIVDRGVEHAAGSTTRSLPLAGDIVGVYFEMTSTRTRTAFSAGALRLGAQILSFGPGDLQINTGESFDDTGRVLARMLDVIVLRIGRPQCELAVWAAQENLATVNAMTEEEHPTQALSDLITMKRRFGAIEGLRVCYVGEGNNTAAALALALPRFAGVELEMRTPLGYGLSASVRARAEAIADGCGASFVECHDMEVAPRSANVIYTTRWQTTGTTKHSPNWREDFVPFQVTPKFWASSPDAVFMHDLPAHRGEEVTADVLDGPMSIAMDQAENKMYSAMAVLEWSRGRCPRAVR